MKYKLTKECKEEWGVKLFRIEALMDFGDVEKGNKGGFVEKEENLSQENDAWVSGDAQVYGDAQVSGDAWVYGDARVYKLKLIGGYFYHIKSKTETIEKIQIDDYELLACNPKLEEENENDDKKKELLAKADGLITKANELKEQAEKL